MEILAIDIHNNKHPSNVSKRAIPPPIADFSVSSFSQKELDSLSQRV
jgi:hypothetical protein